jgi:hypothetical protein
MQTRWFTHTAGVLNAFNLVRCLDAGEWGWAALSLSAVLMVARWSR